MKRRSVFVLFALLTMMALAPPALAQDDVILPTGSIDAIEILNEAGAAQSVNAGINFLSGTEKVVESTITAPSSGYVLVIGSGQITAAHVTGHIDDAVVGVSVDCDATPTLEGDQNNRFLIPSFANSFDWAVPFSAQKLFPVSAGDTTFCVVATELLGDISVASLSLSLLFIPTSYGSVEQSAPAPDSEDAADARAGGRTQSAKAREQSASIAANQARIDRELSEMRARVEELERYLEQVRKEQAQGGTTGGGR